MYHNLNAELARENLRQSDLAAVLGVSEQTIGNKIRGKTAFTLPEAVKIKARLFPNQSIEYLFDTHGKAS